MYFKLSTREVLRIHRKNWIDFSNNNEGLVQINIHYSFSMGVMLVWWVGFMAHYLLLSYLMLKLVFSCVCVCVCETII